MATDKSDELDQGRLEKFEAITGAVLNAAFEVANTLGCGFFEKVYERALVIELQSRGLRASAQVPMAVMYKGQNVGDYFADVLVEDIVAIELKCVERLGNEHMAQCMNYLTASGLDVCLLINFQHSRLEWKRILSRI
ncbi:MAG TPA: GxxExxY protein [Bryobacteraceae bacterium]|nr:GxxExxY protein [Bryobacteraceae bacterium]